MNLSLSSTRQFKIHSLKCDKYSMRCYFATPLRCSPTFCPPCNVLCTNSSKSCNLSSKSCTPCPSNWSKLDCLSRPCTPCYVPCNPCESVCRPCPPKEKLFNPYLGAVPDSPRTKKKPGSKNAKGGARKKGSNKDGKLSRADKEDGKLSRADKEDGKDKENKQKGEKGGKSTIKSDSKGNVIDPDTKNNENRKSGFLKPESKGVLVGPDQPGKFGDNILGQNGSGDPKNISQSVTIETGTCTPRAICRCQNQRRAFPQINPYHTCSSRANFNGNTFSSHSRQNNFSGGFQNPFKTCVCRNKISSSRYDANTYGTCGERKWATPSRVQQKCSLCGNRSIQSSGLNFLGSNYPRPSTPMPGLLSGYGNDFNYDINRFSRPSVHQGTFSRNSSAMFGGGYYKCGTCGSSKMLGGPPSNNVLFPNFATNQQPDSVYGAKRNIPMSISSFNCQMNPNNMKSQRCPVNEDGSSRININVSQKMNLIYPRASKKICCSNSREVNENSKMCCKSPMDIFSQRENSQEFSYHLCEFST